MPATPVFQRLPPLVVALVAGVLGLEAAFQLGTRGIVGGPEAVGWRIQTITALGFSDPLFEHMATMRRWPPADLARFVSYAPVHLNGMHALFGAVLLLAMGKAVCERFSALMMLVIFLAATAGGALAYGVLQDGRMLLVGVYPAVYGLIGAYTWALFTSGEGRARLAAFRLIAVLAGLQLLFRMVFGGADVWLADLGGFIVGFALAPLLAPDGAARLRRLRDRLRRL